MISRDMRLRRKSDFETARSRGKSWNTRLAVIVVHPNGLDHNRYGFATGKKIGGAVQRNRAKRLFREAVRHEDPHLIPGHDIIFIARNVFTPDTPQTDVSDVVRNLTRRAGIRSESA
ncbi:ribonuclease P protein component [soil metagenome]